MAAAHYPYVVRARGWPLFGHIFFCAVIAAVCVTMIVLMLGADGDRWIMIFMIPLYLTGLLWGIWEALVALSQTTTYDREGVTVSNRFRTRRFERSSLHNWRWGQESAGLRIVELYEAGSQKRFVVFVEKKSSEAIAAWFGDAPSAEHEQQQAALAALERDESFGSTPKQRVENADQERRIQQILYWLALALMLWAFAFPRPYKLAIGLAIAAPIALFVATFVRRDRWRLERQEGDFRPATGGLIMLCTIALAGRAALDWRLLDWPETVALSLLVGAALTILAARLFGAEGRSQLAGWFAVSCLYAFGAVVPLNMWLDRAPPSVHRAVVEQKRSESVDVRADAPFANELSLDFSARTLEQITVGEEICLDLYRGAFGIRSYDYRRCT